VQDRPTVLELLAAVRGFLERDVVPALAGRTRFHALVAANVLGIVEREIERDEDQLLAEWIRLARLLDVTAEPPAGPRALRSGVRERTERLVEGIRRGEADAGPHADAVRAHVRATVVEKLSVANPKYGGT